MKTELETHKCKNCIYCCKFLRLTEPPVCSFDDCYEPLGNINIENNCCNYEEEVKE